MTAPDAAGTNLTQCPKLVVMDLLGTLVEHDRAVKGALAAAFQAHGETIDEDVASIAIGFPGLVGVERILRWLHPSENPHPGSVNSIHDLAVKELVRLVKHGAGIQPADGVRRLCRILGAAGIHVAVTTTLHADVVRPLLRRFGWDVTPPFSALVLAEEVEHPTPGPDMILECMRRCGVEEVDQTAKVACRAIGLAAAKNFGCGWTVLVDDGTLTTDHIAAIGPSAIVDRTEGLLDIWTLPTPPDLAIDDEIAKVIRH